MGTACWIFALALACVAQGAAVPVPFQAEENGLNAARQRLLSETGDLTQMAAQLHGIQQTLAYDITGSAEMATVQVDSATILIGIFGRMETDKDRAVVAFALSRQLTVYDAVLGQDIEDVNGYSAVSSSPAVVQEAANIRDEMKRARAIIEQLLPAFASRAKG